jgi:hypothetical protein
MTGENGPLLEGWTLPTRKFCARLIGDDLCDCVDCQIAAHEPLGGRGDN